MSNNLNIPTDTTIEDLLSKIMPKIGEQALKDNNSASELAGTEISMVIEVGGDAYSYQIKDGAGINFSKGDTDNAMLRLKISEDTMEKMIKTENLTMLVGIQNDLSRAKYNALSSLKGTFESEVYDDSNSFVILATLNGASDPKCSFRMSASDTEALMNKETNPVNLFMSGAMQIDGDMAFAMATQPLFT